MEKMKFIRNIDIAAHIDHGKTTFSDNLIASAGMMSEELAGKQLLLDFDEQEQARGITINAANVSMVHEYKGDEYLVNLIDTPGHVDFGGDVTRAMRAVDGCIILVCAVEGAMPQTETVVRQALREKVKPVLFINKVDRLINELKLTPEQLQEKFGKIIVQVNQLIQKMVPPEFKGKWAVRPDDGTVAFGSSFHNWAISVPYMKKTGITFKDIIDHCNNDQQKELSKKAVIHEVALEMVIEHLPNPLDAQKYRIPHIWRGDLESEAGQTMLNCKPNGPAVFMVTKIWMDPHAGEIATGRLYGGTVRKGDELSVIGQPGTARVQQVGVFVGADRITVDHVSAGNIAGISGIKAAIAGSTVTSDPELDPFERIIHVSEPVVTKAIEAKHMKDLPKLVDVLHMVAKADPSLVVEINQETGEHLLSGMGELHLEITEYRIEKENGIEIVSSQPIVVYREKVAKPAGPWEGKSPNKHNRFYVTVEHMDPKILAAIQSGEISTGKVKGHKEFQKQMVELGMSKDVARMIYAVHGTSMIANMTKGIQYLFETKELIIDAFNEVMKAGPLAREPVMGLMFKLVDAKLHEDAIHRGPAQIIPAVRNAIYGAMVSGGSVLMEPNQKVFISIPQDLMGSVSREMQQRRGTIEDMQQDGDTTTMVSKAPVAELFGFSNSIRSATQGRALWSTEFAGYSRLPGELQKKIVKQIRERKGLKPEPPTVEYYRA